MANTHLHGATHPNLHLQYNTLTARGIAPGCKTLPSTLDPYRVVIVRYLPLFKLYVELRDMSTIIIMSTIITTTIITTLHKGIFNTGELFGS